MSVSFEAHAIVAPDVLFRTVGGESVILDLKTERYLGLDAVGTRMWSAALESSSIRAAFETLLAEYDVDPDRLQVDLEAFLQKLVEQGLITLVATGADAPLSHCTSGQ